MDPSRYSRFRSRREGDGSSTRSYATTHWPCSGVYGRYTVPPTTSYGYGITLLQRDERMWDNLTPGFEQLVEDHSWLPINAMYQIKRRIECLPGLQFIQWPRGLCPNANGDYVPGQYFTGKTIIGNIACPPLEAIPAYHNIDAYQWVEDNISYSLLAADADAKSGFDLLTQLGEGKETIGYIANSISRLRDLVKLRFLSRPRRPITRSDLGSAWLEYRYAFSPLLYGIEDGLAYFQQVRSRQARGRNSRKQSFSTVLPFSVPDYNGAPIHGKIHLVTEAKIRAGSLYNVSNAWNGLQVNLGTTLWELTTLSFVVDWFVGIGDYVTSITPQPGFTPVGLWYSVTIDTSVQGITIDPGVNYSAADGSQRIISPSIFSGKQRTYWREPAYRSQISWVPEVNINLNAKRVTDAIALLNGFLTGKGR